MKSRNGGRLTTFEVARFCGVHRSTAINWVKQGKLKAYKTPGGHRRIAAADLAEFMRRYGLPLPVELSARPRRVLAAAEEPAVQRLLRRVLAALPGVELRVCESGLEALLWIGQEAPDLFLLDWRMPRVDGARVCRLLKTDERTRPIKIIALAGGTLHERERRMIERHANALLQKPLAGEKLREAVARILELEGGEVFGAHAN